MKKCIICGKKLYLTKFKSLDGYICKNCYKIASLNFSRTVTQLSKNQIENICQKSHEKINTYPKINFEITNKIGGYILFDDKHKLLCLPNNSRFTDKKLKPEYYPYSSVRNIEVIDNKNIQDDKELHTLYIEILFFKSHEIKRKIILISKPISAKTNIYHILIKLAQQIQSQVQEIISTVSSN